MTNKTLSFIVRRLCFSKKNKGIVHVISLISLIGIAVGSFALIVVVSVFNGFTTVAKDMLEKNNPPILISAKEGKVIDYKATVAKINKTDNIKTIIPVVQETAMITNGENQSIVTMVGIEDSYFKYNHLDTSLVNGKNSFKTIGDGNIIMGLNLAMSMGLSKGSEEMNVPIKITIPNKDNEDAIVVEDMFKSIMLSYVGCFATHSDIDDGYIFIPINRARELLSYSPNQVTSIYVLPKDKSKIDNLEKDLKQTLNNKVKVENILEQQPIYFRIVKSEKMAVYVILSLIIFIATINVISSIIILYIQKQKMNYILRAIGTTKKEIKKLYFYYGLTLNIIGCLIGVIVGVAFCLIQQKFGIIKLQQDSFVVDSFPIKIFFTDIIRVLLIVLIIGALSISMVVKKIKIR